MVKRVKQLKGFYYQRSRILFNIRFVLQSSLCGNWICGPPITMPVGKLMLWLTLISISDPLIAQLTTMPTTTPIEKITISFNIFRIFICTLLSMIWRKKNNALFDHCHFTKFSFATYLNFLFSKYKMVASIHIIRQLL